MAELNTPLTSEYHKSAYLVDVNGDPLMVPTNPGSVELYSGGSANSATNPIHTCSGDCWDNDAFGRYRTSQPTMRLDAQHHYGQQHYLFNAVLAGGATLTDSMIDSSLTHTVTSTVGSKVTNRSKRQFYQAGLSHLIAMTFNMQTTQTGIVKRIGYFDTDDGVFLENNGGALSVILRHSVTGSVVEDPYPRSMWFDKLDGTGPSGITLNESATNILLFDLQWLGVGRARCALDIDGVVVPFVNINNANNKPQVYMQTANLPVTYEIENVSSLVGSTMMQICSAVYSEGSTGLLSTKHSQSNGIVSRSVGSTVFTPVLAIQPALLYKGRANKGEILPLRTELFVTGNNAVHWELWEDAVITGGVWNPQGDAPSMAEYKVTATSVSTPRSVRGEGYAAAGGKGGLTNALSTDIQTNYSMQIDATGLPDSMTLVAKAITGNATVYGAVEWGERY